MTFVVGHFDVGDYDAWKQMYDADPAGRKQAAKGHVISRSVDNPGEVFVRDRPAAGPDACPSRVREPLIPRARGDADRTTGGRERDAVSEQLDDPRVADRGSGTACGRATISDTQRSRSTPRRVQARSP